MTEESNNQGQGQDKSTEAQRSMVGEVVRVQRRIVQQGIERQAGPYAAIITGEELDPDGDIVALNAAVFLVGTTQHERLVDDPKPGEWSLA